MLSLLLKVGGIGSGLIVIFIFAILCLLVCFFGAKSQHPGIIFCVSLIIFIAVILILVLVPKQSNVSEADTTAKVYDNNAPFRLACFIILLVIMVFSLGCYVIHIVMQQTNAARIEQQLDPITGAHYSIGFVSFKERHHKPTQSLITKLKAAWPLQR
jgi:amino acid permease